MAQIETIPLPCALSAQSLWPALAGLARQWLEERALPVRDAIVLLPYAALLPLARAAFAQAGGWQPRIETPLTLAATLAPVDLPAPGQVSGDALLDRLHAMRLLRRQPWAEHWSRRDPRGFEHLVALMVDAAQVLQRAAGTRAPAQRAAFWEQARALAQAPAGPGTLEQALLLAAIEWAALPGPLTFDDLYDLRPAGWILLRIGGADAQAEALVAASGRPALLFDADPPEQDPFGPTVLQGGTALPSRWVCDGFEDEARAATAQVIAALDAGRLPVALVALDRTLARRVRALLGRCGIAVADETGWRLSTTPAAARVLALLRAAAPAAGADARLDWFKCMAAGVPPPAWVAVLEADWRELRQPAGDDRLAVARRQAASAAERLAPFGARRERPLSQWLGLLREALELPDDDADAAAVRRALRLVDEQPSWLEAAAGWSIDLATFTDWVDGVLDAENREPPIATDAAVVLTPLARAIGRPFARIVLPGCDHAQLGAAPRRPTLIGERMAQELAIETGPSRQRRERLSFAQLLRAPDLVLLRRRLDGDEPRETSPLLQWLQSAFAAATPPRAWPEVAWRDEMVSLPCRPVLRPAPTAATALPVELSASAVGRLRDCPYRFFVRSVLRLEEGRELEQPPAKREYGSWLHLLLFRFHRDLAAGQGAATLEGLEAAGRDAARDLGLDQRDLLPFAASFAAFSPKYLEWLGARGTQGWHWQSGEADHRAAPPALAPQVLKGRLDRIDGGPDGVMQVIDYKAGNRAELQRHTKQPLESPQLAFYAALLLSSPAAAAQVPQAAYLTLDDAQSPELLPLHDTAAAVQSLIDGLAADFAALRQGASMPALGEGRVCETCEARGLCRRDHWPAA